MARTCMQNLQAQIPEFTDVAPEDADMVLCLDDAQVMYEVGSSL